MKKIVLCVVIFALVAAIQATAADTLEGDVKDNFQDYWSNDYNFYDYSEENNNDKVDDGLKEENVDKRIEDEIQEFIDQNVAKEESHNHEDFGPLLDYQFEDNRSNTDDKEVAAKKNDGDILPIVPPLDEPLLNSDDIAVEPVQPSENSKENDEDEDIFGAIWREEVEDVPLLVPETNKVVSKEIQEKVNDTSSDKAVSEEKKDPTLDQINEETSKLLQKTEEVNLNSENDKNKIDDDMEVNYDDDTPEKVLKDLSADLDKLFETLDKLSDNDADVDTLLDTIEKLSDTDSDLLKNYDEDKDSNLIDNIEDYEEKYKRPYREGYIMSLRDDYDTYENNTTKPSDNDEIQKEKGNSDVENKSQTVTSKSNEEREITASIINNKSTKASPLELSSEINYDALLMDYDDSEEHSAEDTKHYYGNDGLVDDQMPKNEDAEVFSTPTLTPASVLAASVSSALVTPASESAASVSVESVSAASVTPPSVSAASVSAASVSAVSVSDASVSAASVSAASVSDASVSAASVSAADKDVTSSLSTEEVVSTSEADGTKSLMVDDLNASQYNEMMSQFAMANNIDLDLNSESSKNDVVPIHVTLSIDEITTITSPNFPNLYPSNIIIDWIFDGPGVGIEMNITALHLNGVGGDYVLVKPGGIDESGSDGLIFSYHLTEERRYRFTNVDRMFVRFESKERMGASGFSISVRMVWPAPELESDVIPEPEAILHPPNGTLALSLAGLTLIQFHNARSEFKELIADLATEYIKDNEIDPGLNTTLEVTQIIRTAVCNIRWPNYETCVEVTFGVPLHYEEELEEPKLDAEDLEDMWKTYIVKEPFASRLRNMGITEYAIPNDRSVLMMWLVIAAGVIIGMALLGFALWRFSCFEDYTRMRSFNDSDSVQNEKRNLDLYPTPHQTLPPLYSDNDYKWADEKYDDSTRVDMGGFANKSYIRDDLFDLDSDEDIIATRDRKGVVINSKDVYDA